METAEYQRLADYEQWYWWYQAQQFILVDTVRTLQLPPNATLVDVGCGTGQNLRTLQHHLHLSTFGVDNSPHAASHWPRDHRTHHCLASANALPYPDNTFDAATCIDVLECRQAEPRRCLNELVRVVRPNQYVIVVAAAYQWLHSPHDRAVHSVRRFTAHRLRKLASQAGLSVVKLTHHFALVFPLIALCRLAHKFTSLRKDQPPHSDLTDLPNWLNHGLLTLTRIEHAVTRSIAAPFGSTLAMVARKRLT